MRLPQSLAASEDDPSSPQVSASTIRCKLLETVLARGEQLAQSNEVENRESVLPAAGRVHGSASPSATSFKNDAAKATTGQNRRACPAAIAEGHSIAMVRFKNVVVSRRPQRPRTEKQISLTISGTMTGVDPGIASAKSGRGPTQIARLRQAEPGDGRGVTTGLGKPAMSREPSASIRKRRTIYPGT
jgi:hypothetical protein